MPRMRRRFARRSLIEQVLDPIDLPALARIALRPLVAQLMDLRLQIRMIEKELLAGIGQAEAGVSQLSGELLKQVEGSKPPYPHRIYASLSLSGRTSMTCGPT